MYLDETADPYGTKLYRILRGDYVKKTSTIVATDGKYTSNTNEIIDEIRDAWLPVYNRHAEAPPDCAIFSEKYGSFFSSFTAAPDTLPSSEDFYAQAQKAKPRVSAGVDGWLPIELKALPPLAWEKREDVFNLCIKQEVFPDDYRSVSSPCLPKKGQGNKQ